MMKLLRDPLALFLAVGLLIYIAAEWVFTDDAEFQIHVTDADIARLQDQWSMQMRRPATEQEMVGLVEQFIKEEIYYREAMRMGLDVNDTIVRRRMQQKLTFLTEDIATAIPPTDDELRAYFEANQENYRIAPQYSFQHRYFSADRREDALSDAELALTNPEDVGDPFMLQRSYTQRSEREIGDLFGRPFAAALAELEPDPAWQGPVESAYGWHAVLVTESTATRLPSFEEVADRVSVDLRQAERQQANDAYYEDLRAQYSVSYPTNDA